MRMTMLATAAVAALALSGAAQAQAPAPERTPARPPAAAPQAPTTPTIKAVNVVDVNELPEATKTQVNEIVSKRSSDDNQKLQAAIEAAPMVKSAVEAKGFSSRDVLIAQMGESGELLVITRKAG